MRKRLCDKRPQTPDEPMLMVAYDFYLESGMEGEYFDAMLAFLNEAEHDYLPNILYERAKLEHDARLEEISRLTPAGIMDSAYEITILNDIMSVLEYDTDNYTTEQIKALASLENPLWSIYTEWMRCDYTLMDDIRYIVGEVAIENASEIDETGYDPENMLEDEDEYEDEMEP